MRNYLMVVVALAIATLRLGAQQDTEDRRWLDDCRDHDHYDHRARFCDVRIERIAVPTGPIDIDARENGGVEVAGGAGSGLVIHEMIEAEAETDAEAQAIASQIHIVTGAHIRADGPPERRHADWNVSYRIESPHHIDISAQSTNGPVEASDVVGQLELRTENGPISLDAVGGNVRARTENGPLEVNVTGPHWEGAGLDASTENGPVELTLPANYGAHLETGTVNGPMEINFPITVQGRFDPKRLSMDIGSGGPTVRAVTTNGPVTIDRK